MTGYYEYSGSNKDNFSLPIQMQLSETLETSLRFFIGFLESALNCQHSVKKSEPGGYIISEDIDSQTRVYLRA